jgi:hypothetical protein
LQHEPLDMRKLCKEAVDEVLASERHLVQFEWDYRS